MRRPWMPLYIADYLHDTANLRAAESGAYLHLIMAYWVKGSLPNDDRQLATIAKMTDAEWRKTRPLIEGFFSPGFTAHKRIDAELAKTADISSKRRAAAVQKHSKRDAIAPANGHTVHTSHSTKIDDEDAGAAGREAFDLAVEIGRVCGFTSAEDWPIGFHGGPMKVRAWLDGGWSRAMILASIKRQVAQRRRGPPNTINFFEKGIAEDIALAAAPLPVAKVIPMQEAVHVQQRPDHIGAAADRLRARFRSEDDASGDEGPRHHEDRGTVEIIPPRKAE